VSVPDLLVEDDFKASRVCLAGTARRGMWGVEAPMVATVAVVGSIRADIVASMPLGCRSNGDVSRPAAGPDGQQQLAGRYTLACIGGGLTADEKSRSDSVLTSVQLNAEHVARDERDGDKVVVVTSQDD